MLNLAESIAWSHHEKVDGSGYPRGLAGEEIPLCGRIAAVADVYDALTRDRPYRTAMSSAEASALMAQGSGSHFDPEVLEVFMLALPVPAPFAA
ncbi:MAG TPA: HD domain-containing phosphohydrolase [Solirubrobacterales bacterium]